MKQADIRAVSAKARVRGIPQGEITPDPGLSRDRTRMSACFMTPPSSHRTRSRSRPGRLPRPARPLLIMAESAAGVSFAELFARHRSARHGTGIQKARGLLISIARVASSDLTPQFMSKPTPPGEMTPSSRENAATPPIRNP